MLLIQLKCFSKQNMTTNPQIIKDLIFTKILLYNFIRVNTFHTFGRAARSSQLIIATHKIFYLALL